MQMPTLREVAQRQITSTELVDWSGCLSVERSGAGLVVVGTRIPPGLILEKYAKGIEIEELSLALGIPELNLEDILIYAATAEREREFPPEVRIDWTGCDVVERVLGRMSGIPVLKNTRVGADSIVENFVYGSSIEEIAENFGLSHQNVEALISFALRRQLDLAS
jgi:uncharacterized protein (DUF433 family)